MRVFIAGATGVLGRRVAARLIRAGARVAGLSRSDRNASLLETWGVEPRAGDLFDAQRLHHMVRDSDAVLHLATAIPTAPRTRPRDWALNDRLRRDGTRALTSAALAAGCRLYVQEGLLHVYGDRRGAWVDEDTPIAARPPKLARSAADAEVVVREAAHRGLATAVLRFGTFYSADSAHTRGLLAMTAAGRAMVIGRGGSCWNPIHVDDAAAAVVSTVERPEAVAGTTLNVCDDEPAPVGAIVDYLAGQLKARPPHHVPRVLARLVLGGPVVEILTASYRARNRRAREVLEWTPTYPTYREGYANAITMWRQEVAAAAPGED